MKVLYQIEELEPVEAGCSVAIGNFDGVHVGHSALFRSMLLYSRQAQTRSAILTFNPHPAEVLNPKKVVERLTTLEEKLALFRALGVEVVVVQKFDQGLSGLSPEDFYLRHLKRGFDARSIHVGFNFHFGKDRQGDPALLRQLCDRDRIFLQVEPPCEVEGLRVSSSLIRQNLMGGDLSRVNRFLGRCYSLTGLVIEGNRMGRQLGFPTANLRVAPEKLLPRNGVYQTRSHVSGKVFSSVTNVGVRPTMAEGLACSASVVVETHLPGFDRELYGEELTVEFVAWIRNEKKFATVDELRAQIAKDVAMACSRD